MTITHILIFSIIAFLSAWLVPPKWKPTFFLITSLVSVYWLQPASSIRNLDFWLPTLAILLTVLVWVSTQIKFKTIPKKDFISVALTISGVIFFLWISRYVEPLGFLTASRPPQFVSVAISMVTAAALVWIAWNLPASAKYIHIIFSLLIVGLLVIQKTQPIAVTSSSILRKFTGQDPSLASTLDFSWLGFSYLSFRLLHALQDAHSCKMNQVSLRNFALYALFFPSYTAGPIDRMQRFQTDLNSIENAPQSKLRARLDEYLRSPTLINGSKRIMVGIFKKFALADSLAIISLNAQNASQVNQGFWGWVLLYAFSIRIYLDFSGYTDIAIGIGNLMGFKLPENFEKPYTKTSLGAFWNSWHITLAQWFRSYFFNPLTRWLRTRPAHFPVWAIILIAQVGTMLLIGLWHGITWNFALWGLWHALGLFIDNRWTDYQRTHPGLISFLKSRNNIYTPLSWFITFHYVTLGWVWFALPEPNQSIQILNKLFPF